MQHIANIVAWLDPTSGAVVATAKARRAFLDMIKGRSKAKTVFTRDDEPFSSEQPFCPGNESRLEPRAWRALGPRIGLWLET
jgi:hypothetical protein